MSDIYARIETDVGVCICEMRDLAGVLECEPEGTKWTPVRLTREQFEALDEFEGARSIEWRKRGEIARLRNALTSIMLLYPDGHAQEISRRALGSAAGRDGT